jgi:hypothetical protein
MATLVSRLTSTGTLILNGEFDEVTQTNIRLKPGSYYAATFDEVTIQGGGVAKRETNTGTILVSGMFDEITTLSLPSEATGGVISNYSIGSNNYQVHRFDGITPFTGASTQTNYTFVLDSTRTIDYLIAGGGGGGGSGQYLSPAFSQRGNPGQGGQVTTGTVTLTAGSYAVKVGTGGTYGFINIPSPGLSVRYGLPGESTTFNGITATGGAGGAVPFTDNPSALPDNSVTSDVGGAVAGYGQPGLVTSGTVSGTYGTNGEGDGGYGGGLGNFNGGAGGGGTVILRYPL